MSQRTSLTRRKWLKTAAATAACGALAGCQRPTGEGSPGGDVLKVFNWSDYIHEDVIPEFEKRTGCTVVYDNYSSDAELETRLATGGGAYDVVFPSDRAMQPLLAKGLLRELDHDRLSNFKHLEAKFVGPPFDPKNRFSAAYFWGTVAVGIRTDHVQKPVRGFEVLFDPDYCGRITMLDDMENVVAAVLLELGLPMNSVAQADLVLAQQRLIQQKPLVQAYTSDSYKERLISGEAWVALGWSGDLMQAADEAARQGHEISVIVPASGTMIWLDSMAIPRAGSNALLAHEFINYLLEPGVAARNAEYVNYATPNAAAYALLPAEMREDASVYPPPATLARCAWLKNRGADIEKIEAVWRAARA